MAPQGRFARKAAEVYRRSVWLCRLSRPSRPGVAYPLTKVPNMKIIVTSLHYSLVCATIISASPSFSPLTDQRVYCRGQESYNLPIRTRDCDSTFTLMRIDPDFHVRKSHGQHSYHLVISAASSLLNVVWCLKVLISAKLVWFGEDVRASALSLWALSIQRIWESSR